MTFAGSTEASASLLTDDAFFRFARRSARFGFFKGFSRTAPFAGFPEAAGRLRGAGFASAAVRAALFFSAATGGFGRFRALSSFGGLPGPRFLGAGSSEALPLSRGFFAPVFGFFGVSGFAVAFGFRSAPAAKAAALARFAVFAGASPLAPFAGRPERFGAGSSSESSCGTRASRLRTEKVRFFRFSRDARGDASTTSPRARFREGRGDAGTE